MRYPEPKLVIAVGTCAISGDFSKPILRLVRGGGNPSGGPLYPWLPPHPSSILEGFSASGPIGIIINMPNSFSFSLLTDVKTLFPL